MNHLLSTMVICLLFINYDVKCITFHSQADVDAFNSSLTSYAGHLQIISTDETDPILDLSNLSNLTSIGGNLVIRNNLDLKQINGLAGITEIGGWLNISVNTSLENLDGLINLKNVGYDVLINLNDSLVHINGLSNLTSIGGYFYITSNGSLSHISDIPNLSSIGGDFLVEANGSLTVLGSLPNLTSLNGDYSVSQNNSLLEIGDLSSLTSWEGEYSIAANISLVSVGGLPNMVNMGGAILFVANSDLKEINGFSGLTSLQGGLTIGNNDSVSNLDGFSNLTSTAYIDIRNNDSITDVDGLSNLISLEGYLVCSNNKILSNLDGFLGLTQVGGSVFIEENDQLTELSGLSNITAIGGLLKIKSNDGLTNLDGLSNVTSVNSMEVSYNSMMTDLEGMSNLETIVDYLLIKNNPLLLNIKGLYNLTSIGGSLYIFDNDSLMEINGFPNLTSIGKGFYIRDNGVLLQVDGLAKLTSIEGNLEVENNSNLSACCSLIPFFVDEIVGGSISIIGNDSGCSSESDIFESCVNGIVKGTHYWDLNDNGTFDEGTDPLLEGQVTFNPSSSTFFSNHSEDGYTAYISEPGTYDMATQPISGWTLNSTPDSYQIEIGVGDTTITDLNFGFVPAETISSVVGGIVSDLTVCDTWVEFTFSWQNTGTTILEGDVLVMLDPFVQGIDFLDCPADEIISPTEFVWTFDSLYPFQTIHKTILLEMPGIDDGFDLGDELYVAMDVACDEVAGAASRCALVEYTPEILCSYDPNDKLVHPDRAGDDNETLFGESLVYTVRFQNMGTWFANDVIVRDTLDPNLDPRTFRLLGSSHPNILDVTMEEDRYMTFSFEDIMLPSEDMDAAGSQGYISYIIEPYPGLDVGTVIENTASIYFDVNPAIVTNTTRNLLTDQLTTSVESPHFPEGIKLYPNPASDVVRIEISDNRFLGENRTFIIHDFLGREVLSGEVSDVIDIDISDFLDGTYFISIFDVKGSVLAREKLLKL